MMGLAELASRIVHAADAHAGLAGWAQAVGATGAIIAAIAIASGQDRSARRAKIEAPNALVDLCVGLGERAQESTRRTRDILLALPPPVAPTQLAYLAPTSQWQTEVNEVAAGLAAIPREEIRDPALAFHLAQLLTATDLSMVMGFAQAQLETARITVNSQEIKIAAALEGIRARRLRR
jgi:hypothetical protein